MKLLAIGRPRVDVDTRSALASHIQTELGGPWSLYAEGVVPKPYSLDDPSAVLEVDAGSIELASHKLTELPLAANQIIDFELIELQPFAAARQLFSATGAQG